MAEVSADCSTGLPSQSRPSHSRSRWQASIEPGFTRARSRSSTRSHTRPPRERTCHQASRNVRACPRCRAPVGLGARRPTGGGDGRPMAFGFCFLLEGEAGDKVGTQETTRFAMSQAPSSPAERSAALLAELAAALPDLPRWVAPRGLLLERRCEVLLGPEGKRGAGYLVLEPGSTEAF